MSYRIGRRCLACFFTLCLFFLAAALRLCQIAGGTKYAAAQTTQSSYRLTLAHPRGTIYDRNGLPLNNRTKRWLAVVQPIPRAVTALQSALKGEAGLAAALEQLKNGDPVVCEIPEKLECDGITCVEVAVPHTSDQPAEHTVGYLDAAGHGIAGLEAAFDDLLYSRSAIQAVFSTDGKGDLLNGVAATVESHFDAAGNYVTTTLDLSVQEVAEQSALQFEKGAIAVCKPDTGELLALVSRPSFDCTDLSKHLNDPAAPLLNRTLQGFSVGSVFKPCIAAAALESGFADFSHFCNGQEEIDGRVFRCHKAGGHGEMSLSDGVCNSCNCYFYTLAGQVGAADLRRMASVLNFGAAVCLAPRLFAETNLPVLSDQKGLLANFAIGQGELLLSPISILSLYCAVVNDGRYTLPHLVSATAKGGKITPRPVAETVAFSPQTAAVLREALQRVVTEGTGTAAMPKSCSAAGKTATAQTGTFDETGAERTNGWFCGYFPAEAPQYVAAVVIEDAIGSQAAAVFAQLADRMMRFLPQNAKN